MKIENKVLYDIWKDRYSKNGESIDGNLHRVANYCSTSNKEQKEFFDIMDQGLFFPAGRTMSNAGIGKDLTLNNCFVAPQIKDDLEDIFDKVKLGAMTHQRGGGIGYDFSQLRPKGSPTSNDAVASGVVSFMDVFNAQTATILQGNRRGANMGVNSIYNMDIEDFVTAKSYTENRLIHFNISVMVDDDFMNAVNEDKNIFLHYPVYDDEGKILKDSTKWKYKKEISATYLWNLIMQKAYDTGEPGLFQYSTMNKDNNLWYIENIVNSNPCAEYLAGTVYGKNPITKKQLDSSRYGGACNLGSLFMHNMIDKPFTKDACINFLRIKNTIHKAIRFLDNIIDINKFPDKIYENYQKAFRTIGMGLTGLSDALCMLNITYGSAKSIVVIDDLMNFIAREAYRTSIELAKEKGSFPFIDKEKFIQSGFIQKHIKYDEGWEQISDDILKYGIRNAKLLSVAPCGTQSLTYGNNCSSSIEPIFSLSYNRKVKMGGQSDDDIKIVKMEDYAYKEWLKIKDTDKCIVKEDVFVTALKLPIQSHLNVLKTIAFHIDMSVSKTINIPTDCPFEEVKNVYKYCWENGIKGCTIFRPNSIRQGILIADDKKETKPIRKRVELPRGTVIDVDDTLIGNKRKLITGCGSLHVEAFFSPETGDMMEVYLAKGSSGGCQSYMNGLSRMMSLALRGGVPIEAVVDQLGSVVTCPSYAVRKATRKDVSQGQCCPNAIGNVLMEMQRSMWNEFDGDEEEISIITLDKENIPKTFIESNINLTKDEKEYISKNGEIAFAKRYNKCPECGETLKQEGGCVSCSNDGFSLCE